jgi:hypothetical protein
MEGREPHTERANPIWKPANLIWKIAKNVLRDVHSRTAFKNGRLKVSLGARVAGRGAASMPPRDRRPILGLWSARNM